MINLSEILVKRDREIIIEEKNVVLTLKAWNEVKSKIRFHKNMNMEIGCYDDNNSATMWFARFKATDKQWKDLIREFNSQNHKLILMDDDKIYLT